MQPHWVGHLEASKCREAEGKKLRPRKDREENDDAEDIAEKKQAYTTTTERQSFGELFWPQRKTFQAGGGYKNPIKTRKTISTTEIFPLWTPFFLQRRKFCAGAGRCMLSFFPALKHCHAERNRGTK